jgi:hypothetical protein
VKPLEDLPNTFWCLMTKGEKYQLKVKGLALLCSILFCLEKLDCSVLQTGLFGFAQQNFYLSFYFLVTVDSRTCCIVRTLVVRLVICF